MLSLAGFQGACLVLSESAADVDVADLLDTPATPIWLRLYVLAGVKITKTGTEHLAAAHNGSLFFNNLPKLTGKRNLILLFNQGKLYGRGGQGAKGEGISEDGDPHLLDTIPGRGGHAVTAGLTAANMLFFLFQMYNKGEIFGGGGGGVSGVAGAEGSNYVTGSGGGGGQGVEGGARGLRGAFVDPDIGDTTLGKHGTAGSESAPGVGGAKTTGNGGVLNSRGGDGGAWGTNGGNVPFNPGLPDHPYNPSDGGDRGRAFYLETAGTVVWREGSDTAHRKGT